MKINMEDRAGIISETFWPEPLWKKLLICW